MAMWQVSGCAMPEPVPVGPNERELLWKKREERSLDRSMDPWGFSGWLMVGYWVI